METKMELLKRLAEFYNMKILNENTLVNDNNKDYLDNLGDWDETNVNEVPFYGSKEQISSITVNWSPYVNYPSWIVYSWGHSFTNLGVATDANSEIKIGLRDGGGPDSIELSQSGWVGFNGKIDLDDMSYFVISFDPGPIGEEIPNYQEIFNKLGFNNKNNLYV